MTKILVIDDEPAMQILVQRNLAARGYHVLGALNGEHGLAVAAAEHPDLILLDLLMPGISGWDVLAALQSQSDLKKTPVIMMTASPQKEQGEKARLAGAVGYLVKPFGVDELLREVRLALGETGGSDDPPSGKPARRSRHL